jgi:hypothetical protein
MRDESKPVKRLSLVLALVPLLITAKPAWAGKPYPTPPFSVVHDWSYEAFGGTINPPWCITEDDGHDREWYGYMTGTFTATDYWCQVGVDDYNGRTWNGGDVGQIVIATSVGTLNQLTLSGQDRNGIPYSQAAALTGSEVVGHGANAYVRNTYTACVFPTGEQQVDVFGGTQTMTVSGTFSELRVQLVAEMPNFITVNHYPAMCPPGQLQPNSGGV